MKNYQDKGGRMNKKCPFFTISLLLLTFLFGCAVVFAEGNSVDGYLKAAKALIIEEKYVEGFDKLKEVIELDPRNLEAMHIIVEQVNNLQIDTDRTYALLEELKVLARKYQDPVYYYYLGNLYENLKFILDAKDAYDEAKVLNKENKALFANGKSLGSFLIESLNGIDKYIDGLERDIGKIDFASQEGRKKAAKLCASVADSKGVDEAAVYYTSAIYLAPDDPEVAKAYVWLGSIMGYSGSIDLPKYYYNKAILINPDLPGVYEVLADFFQMIKDQFPEKWGQEKNTELYNKTVAMLKKQGKTDLLSKIEK